MKVKDLRVQSALCNGDTPLELVSDDPRLQKFLDMLEIVEVYPDTTSPKRGWSSTFKIKVK